MADNKQYITQVQDNGRIMISESVISTIVTQALTDIEGYAGLYNKSAADFVDLVGKKNRGKGVRVSVDEKDQLTVDCNIIVSYGHSIVTIAAAVQEAAAAAVLSMTGIKVQNINVNVCGIVRK